MASAASGSPHKLILNKDGEERVFEVESIEQAFDHALRWVIQGYIARIVDDRGVVKFTQALSNGQVTTFKDDATEQPPRSRAPATRSQPIASPRKSWWRFW